VSFPRYPEYKNSGVDWLGEAPINWSIGRLKYLLRIRGGQDYKAVESADPKDYPVIGSGGHFTYATSFLYDGESVLLGRKGTIDKPLYIRGKFWTVDTMFYTEVLPKTYGRYAYYAATTIPFSLYSTNTALPSMSQFDLANHALPLPSYQEQTQIARFLDHETAKIDTLIHEQKRLIELLKEKRQAVISHAVTKGLDPDVPMKDSGVKWLGEVPAHWQLKRLKQVTSQIIDGAHFTPTYVDTGIPFIRVKDIQSTKINMEEIKRIPEDEHAELIKRCHPAKGDILLSKNGTIGLTKIVDWDFQFSIFVSLCLIKSTSEISSEFLEKVLSSNFASEQFRDLGQKTSVTNLHLEKIREMIVLLPTIAEQSRICSFVDLETAKLALLSTEALEGIALLKERRSALISAAVTGKIDVRNWQPPADESAFDEKVSQAGMEAEA